MTTTLKEIAQVFSLLLGTLLIGNVLFHLVLYIATGTALNEVMWEVHFVTASIGAALLYVGSKLFK